MISLLLDAICVLVFTDLVNRLCMLDVTINDVTFVFIGFLVPCDSKEKFYVLTNRAISDDIWMGNFRGELECICCGVNSTLLVTILTSP